MQPTTPATQAVMQAAVAPPPAAAPATKPITREAQWEALSDAMQTRPELLEANPRQAYEKLAAEGHPLFKGIAWGAAPTEASLAAGTPAPVSPPPPAALAVPSGQPVVGGELFAQPPRVPAPAATRMDAHVAMPSAAPQLPAPAAPAHVGHAAPMTGLEGLEEITGEDVKVPGWKIRQPTSGSADAAVLAIPAGSIFLTFDPAGHAPKRVGRVLDITKGRSFLPPYGNSNDAKVKSAQLRERLEKLHGVKVPEDKKVICSSPDRKTPEDRGWGTLAKTCAECPYSKWTVVGGVRKAPECQENYKTIIFDEPTQTPAIYLARGSAIKSFKNLVTNLMIAGNREKRPPAGFRTCIETKKETDGTNTWYVPAFGPLLPVSDEELEQGLNIRRAIVANRAALAAAETDDAEHEG